MSGRLFEEFLEFLKVLLGTSSVVSRESMVGVLKVVFVGGNKPMLSAVAVEVSVDEVRLCS